MELPPPISASPPPLDELPTEEEEESLGVCASNAFDITGKFYGGLNILDP